MSYSTTPTAYAVSWKYEGAEPGLPQYRDAGRVEKIPGGKWRAWDMHARLLGYSTTHRGAIDRVVRNYKAKHLA